MWLPAFLQLKASDPDVRLQAVRRLAESKSPRAVQPLADAFLDEAPVVSLAAAVALGKLGSDDAIQFLTTQVRVPSPQLRQTAVDGLKQKREDPNVQAVLIECLKDIDAGVRGRAAQALQMAQWRPIDVSEEIWFAVAQGQLTRAAKHGSHAIEALELVMSGGPFNLQIFAIKALGTIPDERIFKSLVGMLDAQDVSVVVATVEALANFGGPKALEMLKRMLKNGEARVRAGAADAMAQLGAQLAVPELIGMLKDEAWDVRSSAVSALGKLKNPHAIEPLIGALKDADKDVRETAIRALGRLADARAIGPMVLCLVDSESGVRRAATSTLKVLSRLWHQTDAAKQTVGELRKALESDDFAIRFAAVLTLQQLGATNQLTGFEATNILTSSVQKQNRVLAIFIELLGDQDSDVRLAAAKSLGDLNDERAVAALKPALADNDGVVRRAVVEALSVFGVT